MISNSLPLLETIPLNHIQISLQLWKLLVLKVQMHFFFWGGGGGTKGTVCGGNESSKFGHLSVCFHFFESLYDAFEVKFIQGFIFTP